LDGVPIAVKDVFDIAGTRTTNGSVVDASQDAARQDAGLIRRLRHSGVVVVGKTTMSELAFSGLGLNPHYGTPANPRSREIPLVPGGSSSGSAVAVASGLVPLAIGTDTSGSVRVPAAFCGIVGYKASAGRFPVGGMRALAPDLDSVGVLGPDVARVRGLVQALTVRAAPYPTDTARLVVPDDAVVQDCDPAVAAWFAAQVRQLAASGLRVEHRALPVLAEAQQLMDDHGTVVAADAWLRYGHLLTGPTAGSLDPAIARRLRAAAAVVGGTAVVRSEMTRLRRRLDEQLAGAYLVCPTVLHPPPPLAEVTRSAAAFDALNARTLRTTMLLSYLGMPGVSLPLSDGGPQGIGLLVSTTHGRDLPLLDVAHRIEAAERSG
jgi:aspartyl-tRNA(Asn)/glutamyl-tRNA(Gln) amidotransferase subunit A